MAVSHLSLASSPTSVERQTCVLPIRVALADAHDAMRRSLQLVLAADEAVEVVGEATDLLQLEELVKGGHPDVVVLCLGLPGGSTVREIAMLRERSHETQIVVLSMEPNSAVVNQVLVAGAAGYVLKQHADRDLLPAIWAAARGESYVTPEAASSPVPAFLHSYGQPLRD